MERVSQGRNICPSNAFLGRRGQPRFYLCATASSGCRQPGLQELAHLGAFRSTANRVHNRHPNAHARSPKSYPVGNVQVSRQEACDRVQLSHTKKTSAEQRALELVDDQFLSANIIQSGFRMIARVHGNNLRRAWDLRKVIKVEYSHDVLQAKNVPLPPVGVTNLDLEQPKRNIEISNRAQRSEDQATDGPQRTSGRELLDSLF